MSGRLTFDALKQRYAVKGSQGFPPLQFRETGPAYHNTCAVRLADALTRVVPKFFDSAPLERWPEKRPTGRYVNSEDPQVGMKFEPAPAGRMLPIRADEVAAVVAQRLGPGRLVTSEAAILGSQGIIFFDHIRGYPGSGHVSLWDRSAVMDGGNHFGQCQRVLFWRL